MSLIDLPWIVLAILAYQGFAIAINGVAAPWEMIDFHLDQAGLAALFAWISLSALGSCLLARAADRLGRRRVLVGCLVVTPLAAAAAALTTSVSTFAACEIVLNASAGAAVASAVVWLAEEVTAERRAMAQAAGGMALAAGNAACLVLMPSLAAFQQSWRLLLWFAAAGVVVVPLAARRLRESQSWLNRPSDRLPVRELFRRDLRRHTWPLVAGGFFSTIAITSATPWRYFRAVGVLGLSPAAASTMLLIVGGTTLLGFAASANACDRIGRVRTLALSSTVVAATVAWSFWGPPTGVPLPMLWLAIGFFGFGTAINAAAVGVNCVVTELYPAPLRGTMLGCLLLVGAAAQVVAQTVTAAFAADGGGVSGVIGWMGWLGLPVAAIFLLFLEEPPRPIQPGSMAQRTR